MEATTKGPRHEAARAVALSSSCSSPCWSRRASSPPAQARAFPGVVPLPDGFQPEGIAIRKAPFAYFGSRVDGDIYRADLRTGKGRVFSQGPGGSPSLGMKLDGRAGSSWPAAPAATAASSTPAPARSSGAGPFTDQPEHVRQRRGADPARGVLHRLQPAVLYRVPLGQRLARPGRRHGAAAHRGSGSRPPASTPTASRRPRTTGRCW